MTKKEQTGKPAEKKAGSDELSEDKLDKVVGGTTIGSATGGAGAGKVTFNPF